ncbi:glycosyl transferase family 1, partial [Escherichia coli]|nr:glycosyl transferase family 1 [Escherichia coli]
TAEVISRTYNKPPIVAPLARPEIANPLTFAPQSLLKRIALRLPLFVRTPLSPLYCKLKN